MKASFLDGQVILSDIPENTSYLRFFVNGIPVWKTEEITLPNHSENLDRILQDNQFARVGSLLQIYAQDTNRQNILDETQITLTESCVDVKTPRNPQKSREIPRDNESQTLGKRLVATSIQNPGDTHTWSFPLAVFQTTTDQQNDVYLMFARLLFENIPTQLDNDIIASISWVYPQVMEHAVVKKRKRGDVESAHGQRSTTVDIEFQTESIFSTTILMCDLSLHPCPALKCTVKSHRLANWPFAGIRYAIYGQMVPISVPPSLYGNIFHLTPPQTEPTKGTKIAVLTGVSKYKRRRNSDLEYADDDVVHWYEYLCKLGYECKIYGDEFSPFLTRDIFFFCFFFICKGHG